MCLYDSIIGMELTFSSLVAKYQASCVGFMGSLIGLAICHDVLKLADSEKREWKDCSSWAF